MGLLRFAHEEAVNERGVRVLEGVLGACCGHVGDDGIGAHGESADSSGLELMLVQEIEDRQSGEAAALGMQGGGAAIDVVVAGAAGG